MDHIGVMTFPIEGFDRFPFRAPPYEAGLVHGP